MALSVFYTTYEKRIGVVFEKYGSFASKYPWYIIAGCVLLNVLLGVGLMRIKSESHVEMLYAPMESRAYKDRSRVEEMFPDKSGENFNVLSLADLGLYGQVMIRTKDGSNILNDVFFEELQMINDFVKNISIEVNGQEFKYSNICAINSYGCGIFGDLIFSESFQEQMHSNSVSFPIFNQVTISPMFGNFTVKNDTLQFASMVKLRYYLRSDERLYRSLSRKWEEAFVDKMPHLVTNLTEIAYENSDSLNVELNGNTKGDQGIFSITFTIMLFYAGFATSGGDCISQRQNLGRAGVLTTLLSIAASFGLVSMCGVKFVNIVGVMPFLLVGIGLDDMFILLSGLADVPYTDSIEDRMKKTMKTSGVAITITSLTDFLAFAIGASSVFLSVKNFCIYTGVGVIVCFLNQLFFFVPCMVLNERRVESRRHCLTCQPIETREHLEALGKGRRFVRCCGGSPPTKRTDNESKLETYPKFLLRRMVLYPPFKVVIILAFCTYLVFSFYGAMHMQQGLKLSNLVDQKSYYYKFATWDEEYFTTQVIISFVFDSSTVYNDTKTQAGIINLIQRIKDEPTVTYVPEWNWMHEYKESRMGKIMQRQSDSFGEGLKAYLRLRPDISNNVVMDDNNNIIASRINIISKNIKHSSEQGNLMIRMRKIADNSGLPVLAHSAPFIFFEQYVAVLPSTLKTVGVAVIVMIVVTAIFMPHPLLVTLVGLTMIMILIGLFGFMYFWDLTLSSVTMIHLIMSIGFSVDFSAHICHAYMCMEGTGRNSMVSAAITRAGGPIFNGAVSTILGIIVLVFSTSYIFQSFFKLMLLVMLFGFAHSMLLLPVILSCIGPEVNVSKIVKDHRKKFKHEKHLMGKDLSNGNIKTNGIEKDRSGINNIAFVQEDNSDATSSAIKPWEYKPSDKSEPSSSYTIQTEAPEVDTNAEKDITHL